DPRREMRLRAGIRVLRRPPVAALPLLVAGVLSTGCAGDEPTFACVPEGAAMPAVTAAGPGAWERDGRTPRLEPLWRAGGLRASEERAYPVGLAVSTEGRAAVTDFSLSEVVVIEPDGRWAGSWARRGEGPGELSTPVAATWDGNG